MYALKILLAAIFLALLVLSFAVNWEKITHFWIVVSMGLVLALGALVDRLGKRNSNKP